MNRVPRVAIHHVLGLGLGLAFAFGLAVNAQSPEPPKKPAELPAKNASKDKELPAIKLPDGTFLWLGTPTDGSGERITLTKQEFQKLLDDLEQLKKLRDARKPTAPSRCDILCRVESRGEQLVAVVKLTCKFRTTQPQTVVSLGGRKGSLVAAAIDGNKLPIIDPTEEGYVAMVEGAGDHTVTLDLETQVAARGAKPDIGFEIGLPHAAITTLLFDPPGPDVKRVNLVTRTPDLTQPSKPPEPKRTTVDVKQLAAKPGEEGGYALGPIESVEVSWEPPVNAKQSADRVQTAEIDVAVSFTESEIETIAKMQLHGRAHEWRVVVPPTAELSVDRSVGNGGQAGPSASAVITKPNDPNRPVWKIALPAGSSASDWVATAVTRQPRVKPNDPRYRGPFTIGPFTVLDVVRQTGMVHVTAGPNIHFAFKNGPDLHKAEPPGPAIEDVTSAFFRLTTGPTGTSLANIPPPLMTIEAWPQPGTVEVTPTYRLSLTEGGWKVRAEIKVNPIRMKVDALAVEIPPEWRGPEASPAELVDGVQQGNAPNGFWAATAARLVGRLRNPVIVRLVSAHKQPFELVLTATIPIPRGQTSVSIPLPHFPGATEKDAAVVATVPEGLEVRGEIHGWNGEFAADWGQTLAPITGADGKPNRVATSVIGKAEAGLSSAILAWNPHRPDLTADIRANITLEERQIVVTQTIRLRSPEGFSRSILLRGPALAVGVRAQPTLDSANAGEWTLTPQTDAKEIALTVSFALPLPSKPADAVLRKLTVGLFWPIGTSRMDTTVRVWSNAVLGRTIANASPGWRELPIEPIPDREALPGLNLFASGGETPLMLEVSDTGGTGAVAVWVERGLIQTWSADEGATSYRARFKLRRWLTPYLEMRLPWPLAGQNPEFKRDGKRVEATPVPDGNGTERLFRVPLPDPRPGLTTTIEVQYHVSAERGMVGDIVYRPPLLSAAAFAGPVRWQITLPTGAMPLLTSGATAEFRWRWQPTGLTAIPAAGTGDLEGWLQSGDEAGGEANDIEVVAARQPVPTTLHVYRVPRAGMIIACSAALFVLVLLVSRLPGSIAGPVVALAAAAVGVAAVFFPHPAAQIAGASQLGFAASALALAAFATARWYHRRWITRIPGFAQTRAEPSGGSFPLPTSTRNRPSAIAASGSAPIAPAGG